MRTTTQLAICVVCCLLVTDAGNARSRNATDLDDDDSFTPSVDQFELDHVLDYMGQTSARVRSVLAQPPDGADDQMLFVMAIESTIGADLFQLRRALDSRLVAIARQLRPDLLERVVRHVEAQLGGDDDDDRRPLKVISDLDDTLFASLHDHSQARRTVYAGVRAFHYAFGLSGSLWDLVAFVTARPEGDGGAFRRRTRRLLEERGYGQATLIMAEVARLTTDALARDKLANYRAYRQFYPEYRFVLVGDSGQADIEFVRAAMNDDDDDRVALALIHDVVDADQRAKTSPDQRRELAAHGVLIFDNYLEAAMAAFRAGLIGRGALQYVRDVFEDEVHVMLYERDDIRRRAIDECARTWDQATALLKQSATVPADDR